MCACSDSPGPAGISGLRIVTAGTPADTVLHTNRFLLVEVLVDGQPAIGVPVIATAVPPDAEHRTTLMVDVVGGLGYTGSADTTTGSHGQASFRMSFGTVASVARLAISVPSLGFSDTAEIDVAPGVPAGLFMSPLDTSLYVGGSYAIVARVTDRYGNHRTEVPILSQLPGTATSLAGTQINGLTIGRASIVVSYPPANLIDTAFASVVPHGVIAAAAGSASPFPGGSIVRINLDGSGGTILSVLPLVGLVEGVSYLQWSPDGSRVLFSASVQGGWHLHHVSLAGVVTRLIPASAGFSADDWARYSADGNWIYFRGLRPGMFEGNIWRIHPDGTGLDSVPVVNKGIQPAPSPDGQRVAYVTTSAVLRLYDYVTGVDTALAVGVVSPHWSPDGSWIAYVDSGGLQLVRPDGSETRSLPGGAQNMDWSPDGDWIIAEKDGFELVNVETGMVLPVRIPLFDPSWRP